MCTETDQTECDRHRVFSKVMVSLSMLICFFVSLTLSTLAPSLLYPDVISFCLIFLFENKYVALPTCSVHTIFIPLYRQISGNRFTKPSEVQVHQHPIETCFEFKTRISRDCQQTCASDKFVKYCPGFLGEKIMHQKSTVKI